MNETAKNRAEMPAGAAKTLDRRTLESANRNVLPLLKTGQTVLDVGCGSGAITEGIARKVGTAGKVIGIDTSAQLIAAAKKRCIGLSQLDFVEADIFDYQTTLRFDLVSSARVLQWLTEPAAALRKMVSLLKANGEQMVKDGYFEETARQAAIREYRRWMQEDAQSMRMYLLAVAGRKNAVPDA